ncbi:hypothetical protein AB0N09_42075, partial [Streptomyces erythrochromogenes]
SPCQLITSNRNEPPPHQATDLEDTSLKRKRTPVGTLWLDFTLLAILGLGNGFLAILLITWMQTRVPGEMTGRLMSLLMLAGSGLVPVSQALAGALGSKNLSLTFILPGALVLLLASAMPLIRPLRRLGTPHQSVQAGRA